MTVASDRAGAAPRNYWRIGRWGFALALLLTPAVMMQISDGWHWTPGSFVVAGVVIGGVLLVYELAERANESRAYRAGVGIALVTAFLTVWTTFVRDDGNGLGFFMVVLAAIFGSYATWFRPAGMARTMIGVAIMHFLVGVSIATAPATTSVPDAPFRILAFCGFFSVLWLSAAMFFRAAARREGVARPL